MNGEETVFITSWGRTTWIMTLVFVVIMAGLGAFSTILAVRFIGRTPRSMYLTFFAIGLILFLAIPLAALFAPTKYVIRSSDITIWRLGPKVSIPMEEIIEVQAIKLKKVVRTFGMGGAFGSYGWFYSPSIGHFRAFITRSDRLVAIKVKKGAPIIVSPDAQEEFIKAAQDALSQEKR